MLALLGESACERSVLYTLSNPDAADRTRFDPYYGGKSELATTILLDNLKRRLENEGFKAGLATEVRDPVGTYDVVVVRGSPCLILKGGTTLARVEIKGSLGLPMAQLTRYLLNPTPLILCRVALGTAVLSRPGSD